MASGIYGLKNIENGKIYIGASRDLHKRMLSHFNYIKTKRCCIKIYKDLVRYDEKSFVFGVIEYCNEKELDEREQFWLDYYRSYEEDKGYNTARISGDIFKNGCYKLGKEYSLLSIRPRKKYKVKKRKEEYIDWD